jgi:hypothetical protein
MNRYSKDLSTDTDNAKKPVQKPSDPVDVARQNELKIELARKKIEEKAKKDEEDRRKRADEQRKAKVEEIKKKKEEEARKKEEEARKKEDAKKKKEEPVKKSIEIKSSVEGNRPLNLKSLEIVPPLAIIEDQPSKEPLSGVEISDNKGDFGSEYDTAKFAEPSGDETNSLKYAPTRDTGFKEVNITPGNEDKYSNLERFITEENLMESERLDIPVQDKNSKNDYYFSLNKEKEASLRHTNNDYDNIKSKSIVRPTEPIKEDLYSVNSRLNGTRKLVSNDLPSSSEDLSVNNDKYKMDYHRGGYGSNNKTNEVEKSNSFMGDLPTQEVRRSYKEIVDSMTNPKLQPAANQILDNRDNYDVKSSGTTPALSIPKLNIIKNKVSNDVNMDDQEKRYLIFQLNSQIKKIEKEKAETKKEQEDSKQKVKQQVLSQLYNWNSAKVNSEPVKLPPREIYHQEKYNPEPPSRINNLFPSSQMQSITSPSRYKVQEDNKSESESASVVEDDAQDNYDNDKFEDKSDDYKMGNTSMNKSDDKPGIYETTRYTKEAEDDEYEKMQHTPTASQINPMNLHNNSAIPIERGRKSYDPQDLQNDPFKQHFVKTATFMPSPNQPATHQQDGSPFISNDDEVLTEIEHKHLNIAESPIEPQEIYHSNNLFTNNQSSRRLKFIEELPPQMEDTNHTQARVKKAWVNPEKPTSTQRSQSIPTEEEVKPKASVIVFDNFDNEEDKQKKMKQYEKKLKKMHSNLEKIKETRRDRSVDRPKENSDNNANAEHDDRVPKYKKSNSVVQANHHFLDEHPVEKSVETRILDKKDKSEPKLPPMKKSIDRKPKAMLLPPTQLEEVKSGEISSKAGRASTPQNIQNTPQTEPKSTTVKTPKNTVAFTKPSNVALTKLSLMNVCLAGEPNRKDRETVLAKMSEIKTNENFIILFKSHSGRQDFRGLYTFDPITFEVRRVVALTNCPPTLDTSMVYEYFKYDSGAKEFKKIATKNFSLAVDAVSLQPNYKTQNSSNALR